MENYSLNLYDEAPGRIELSRRAVLNRARNFRHMYASNHPAPPPDELQLMIHDMEVGRFWGILSMVDGYQGFTGDYDLDKAEERRRWARESFMDAELQELLDICANIALLVPIPDSPRPGNFKGHSILYEALVKNPGSLFEGAVSAELRKRLINGRFWEELPDMKGFLNYGLAYAMVDDVLTGHYSELDTWFAPKGFAIFYRNLGGRTDFDLRGLSDEGIGNYASFVKRVHRTMGKTDVSAGDIARLVAPYVAVLLETDQDYIPRFDRSERSDLKRRLKDPLVTEYLAGYPAVRRALGEELNNTYRDGDNPEFVRRVLGWLPRHKDVRSIALNNL